MKKKSVKKSIKKTTKRNPQDATMRNIRALKKRVEKIESFLDYFHADAFKRWSK